MAESFTLDTSGAVPMGRGENMGFAGINLTWGDIGALPYGQLAQGYIEAALRAYLAYDIGPNPHNLKGGFSDLAPATLARILKDCERFTELYGEWPLKPHGEGFWIGRQKNKHSPEFPPLTLHLGDDGLIYFGEVG